MRRVRQVIPSKDNYLASPSPLATGGEDDPFARHLRPLLAVADPIDIVAAFVQDSGLDRIERDLDLGQRLSNHHHCPVRSADPRRLVGCAVSHDLDP